MTDKIAVVLLLIVCCLFQCEASSMQQQNLEMKRRIAQIKKQADLYVIADVTAETPARARQLAEDILWDEVGDWASTQPNLKNTSALLVERVDSLVEELTHPRGNMYRSFLYVKKSDIANGASAKIIEKSIPASVNNPVAATTPDNHPVYPSIIQNLAAITDYSQIALSIKKLAAEGKIGTYGRYASLQNPEQYYLVIYNRAGQVMALLSPGEQRVNVKTGEPDAVANYSGCGAIGLKLP